MPRRVEPNLGRDEVVEVRKVEIDDTAMAKLLDLLGVQRDERAAVALELNKIATRHATWRAQEEDSSRKRSIAALEVLKKAADRLAKTGNSSNRDEVWAVVQQICDVAEAPFLVRLASLHHRAGLDADAAFARSESVLDRPDLIAAAAQGARDELGVRGPRPDNSLYLTVKRLVDLFERTTGRVATYGQSAPSPAGRFIEAFFAEVEPRLPRSRPDEALRRIIAERNRRREQLSTGA
jgi:hypothetical protein